MKFSKAFAQIPRDLNALDTFHDLSNAAHHLLLVLYYRTHPYGRCGFSERAFVRMGLDRYDWAVAVDAIAELEAAGFVETYTVRGNAYLQIPDYDDSLLAKTKSRRRMLPHPGPEEADGPKPTELKVGSKWAAIGRQSGGNRATNGAGLESDWSPNAALNARGRAREKRNQTKPNETKLSPPTPPGEQAPAHNAQASDCGPPALGEAASRWLRHLQSVRGSRRGAMGAMMAEGEMPDLIRQAGPSLASLQDKPGFADCVEDQVLDPKSWGNGSNIRRPLNYLREMVSSWTPGGSRSSGGFVPIPPPTVATDPNAVAIDLPWTDEDKADWLQYDAPELPKNVPPIGTPWTDDEKATWRKCNPGKELPTSVRANDAKAAELHAG